MLVASAPVQQHACMCETPKSPPGDYKVLNELASKRDHSGSRVKHLNPRQGITSLPLGVQNHPEARCCVKHLNPRQGITTCAERQRQLVAGDDVGCETPKSPPGDYNAFLRAAVRRRGG